MTNFAEILHKNTMKNSLFAFTICFLMLISGCADDKRKVSLRASEATNNSKTIKTDTIGEIVSRVKQQGRLYTTEYQIHKVILYTDEAHIGGALIDIPVPGDRKAAIPIDVTLKGYVDFSTFTTSNVIYSDSLCIINLPNPKIEVTSSKIDHKGTRQYISMTRSKFSEAEISRLATQGEDTIINHIKDYGIIDQTRESCARTLMPILTVMGFKENNVIIRFSSKFTDADIRRLTSIQK